MLPTFLELNIQYRRGPHCQNRVVGRLYHVGKYTVCMEQ